MDILSKNQAQDRIGRIDTAVVPFSVTNGMVASVLNYLMRQGESLGDQLTLTSSGLDALSKDFDLLAKSVGYPGGIAVLDDRGKLPRRMLPVSVFRFDGFRSMGDPVSSGLLWAPPSGEIFFDEAKNRFFLRTGGLLFPKDYISWGSNQESETPASADLGPDYSSIYIFNDELYVWTGERLKKIASFQGNANYDDSELRERIEQLADIIIAGSGAIGDVICDTGPYDNNREYRCCRMESATKRVTDDAWVDGCRWRCLVDGTTGIRPGYGVAQWGFVGGDPAFSIDFEEKQIFYNEDEIRQFGATLTLMASLYNQDVLASLRPSDIVWSRESYDSKGKLRAVSVAAWNPRTDRDNKRLLLDFSDLDYDGTEIKRITFICTATIDDSGVAVAKMDFE